MKQLLIPGVAALTLMFTPIVHAQEVVRETTTTAAAPLEATGTLTEWGPNDTMIVRERDVTEPVRFGFAKNVVYVDEAGNPVTREVITPNTPVRVRYIREGDRMLVDRVIVTRPATTEATTTTTTTTSTVTGREAKDIRKLREKIAHDEKELAEHPDRVKLQEELDHDRAALHELER